MIRAYVKSGKCLAASEVTVGAVIPAQAIWLDLINPTLEEDKQVEAFIGSAIPTREDMREIEESSRLYEGDGAHYMTAPLLHSVNELQAGLEPVTFVLAGDRLITVRYSAPRAFDMFAARMARGDAETVGSSGGGKTLVVALLESVTDRLADLLEDVAVRLEKESDSLFLETKSVLNSDRFRNSMKLIGREGAFLGKVSESVSGLERMSAYLGVVTSRSRSKVLKERLKLVEKDLQSLSKHTTSLESKVTFLLDTVVGLVSVEQNAIIKIFSVAAVAFMPPTLVASIYGMNFDFMPELQWLIGYPMALGLMLLSAIIPLIYFKFKGWL
ncbi:MAG: magnesium transporter CorA family protein [Rhizobiaceae bacterium]